jgi:hypothetical protein
VFANKHRYVKNKKKAITNNDDEIDAEQGPQEEDVNKEAEEAEMLESKRLVKAAGVHVKMAQQQWELYQYIIRGKQSTSCTMHLEKGSCAMLLTMPRTCLFQTLRVNNLELPTTSHH